MAAMTRSQAQMRTREKWEARALELAEARHLAGTARLLEQGFLRGLYGVPSRTAGGEYVVIEERLHGRVTCSCPAGMRHFPCSHAGAH